MIQHPNLDIDALLVCTARLGPCLSTRQPCHVMRLLEVVRGAGHRPETRPHRGFGFLPQGPGGGRVCHGFDGNRMLRLRSVEAERLLLEGALPQDVDGALTEFGFPMGPFAMADLAGLDVGWRMRKAQGLSAPIADQLCERGRYGQKTSRGFYLYEPGSRTPNADPEVERLILDTAAQRGIARGALGKDAIVERLLFPMINEGARILHEGIAQRPGDIDVIWVYGYGFPVYRGGPMHYADSVGLRIFRLATACPQKTGDDRCTAQRR